MSQVTAGGYDPAFFAKLELVEDSHFWFRARKRAVGTVVRGLARSLAPGYNALEIGCGNGGMLRLLQQSCPGGRVFGMDLFAEALRNARYRSSCQLVQGDVHLPPFSEAFQIVGMFDVLEHLKDDVTVLGDVRTMLAPGGRVVLTVPAHMSLWSYFDEACFHVRRYTSEALAERIAAAGLVLDYQTEFMSWIFPLVWVGRRMNHHVRRGRNGAFHMTESDFRVVPVLNTLLDWSLGGEADLIRRRRHISRGTSLLAIARRP